MDKTNPLLTMLEPIRMQGPIETHITIHVRLPDGRNASMTLQMEPGRIPTRAAIQEVLDECLNAESMEETGIPEGTRLLTKPEFIGVITRRETGIAVPMPGVQEWEPAASDIPRSLLVHAIAGAGLPNELGQEYVERGLGYSNFGGVFLWNEVKLAELPDDMLLTIYKRIA